MSLISGLLQSCGRHLQGLAALPAESLASFMDEVDEVWVSDAFMDQPDAGIVGRW